MGRSDAPPPISNPLTPTFNASAEPVNDHGSPIAAATAPAAVAVDSALEALRRNSERLALLIRDIRDPSTPIPHLDWSVGDAATHLVLGARLYETFLSGAVSPVNDFTEVATVNALSLQWVEQRDPNVIADCLLDGDRALDYAFKQLPVDELVPWHAGLKISAPAAVGLRVGELVVHGWDIATALRVPWRIERHDALVVIQALLELAPHFVDRRAAGGLSGIVEVTLRGGPRVMCVFDDGALTISHETVKPRADCHISADPEAFLLLGYKRVSQWRPMLAGKLFVWGRKPWLALKLATLFKTV